VFLSSCKLTVIAIPNVAYEQVVRLKEALDHAGDPDQLITLHGPVHGWAVERN
jgi:hypothetical protein